MEIITIFTTGETKGNPGLAEIKMRIMDASGKVLKETTETIGNATKNFADYQAVMRGLQIAEEYFNEKTKELQFELKLNNQLVKRQLNNETQITEPALVPCFIEIHNLQISNFVNLKFKLASPEEK